MNGFSFLSTKPHKDYISFEIRKFDDKTMISFIPASFVMAILSIKANEAEVSCFQMDILIRRLN